MHEVGENLGYLYREKSDILSGKILDEIVLSQTIYSDGIEATYYQLNPDLSIYVPRNNCFLAYQGIYVGSFDFFKRRIGEWFVLINISKDLFDISVSRENIINNEKKNEFISLLYDNFLKLIENITLKEVSKENDYEYCIKYSETLSNYLDADDLIKHDSIEFNNTLKIILKKIYPVYDSESLKFFKGEVIFSKQIFKKIYRYILPVNECKHHIQLIMPLLKELIKEGDLVIFDLGPHFLYYEENEKNETVFRSPFEYICKINGKDYEDLSLFNTLNRLTFEKIKTPIDELLPINFSFIEMPKDFRSMILCKKPYIFKTSENKIIYSDFTYRLLLKRELFAFDPDIYDYLNAKVAEYKLNIKEITPGEYLFDINDPFFNFLIENAEKIKLNSSIKNLVLNYLYTLVLLTNMPVYNIFQEDLESDFLLLEKNIVLVLEYKEKYENYFKRLGKINNIIRSYGVIQFYRLFFWDSIR